MKRVYINFGVSSFISQLTDLQFVTFLSVVTKCYERLLCNYSFIGGDLRIDCTSDTTFTEFTKLIRRMNGAKPHSLE